MELRMSANLEGGPTAFSSGKKGGKWSRAPKHPPHPTPGTSSGPIRKPSIAGTIIPKTSLRIALETPGLLANAISGDSWLGWRSILLAALGENLRPDELALYQKFTERQAPPTERVSEFVGIIGR